MNHIFFKRLLVVQALLVGVLQAQADKTKGVDNPSRTLRVIVVGTRPLPVFETRGDKVVEVDPPQSKLPPTSFEFLKPKHAPRSKAGTDHKTSFSAWPCELVKINQYKGPALLPLNLKWPLIGPDGAKQLMSCALGDVLNPLILVHPDPGPQGWNNPKVKIVDFSLEKMPVRSIMVVNLSALPIKVYLSKKGEIVAAGEKVMLRLPINSKDTFRYRVDVSDGKHRVTLCNSSYRLSNTSRLIILSLPGHKKRGAAFTHPKLRIIEDRP